MWYIIALSHMTGLMPIPSKGGPMTLRPIRNEEDYETDSTEEESVSESSEEEEIKPSKKVPSSIF